MANIITKLDEWGVKDLEDNTTINVEVFHYSEMGNNNVPGLHITATYASPVNYEPLHVERWAYAAKKAHQTEYLIENLSWMTFEDTYVKHFLLIGDKLKAKVEVKVRSKERSIVKEYELPFTVDV
jgi:hypothetical protein